MPEPIMLLVLSMLKRREITLENQWGVLMSGIISSIEAEDGSGTSFNIRLNNGLECYLKRPEGMGTMKDPIKTNKNVESYELAR
jgi:hypothetical protein